MNYGWITEGFCILPSISINWMRTNWVKPGQYTKVYDVQFAWLWWYISTNNIGKALKEYERRH